MGRADTRAFESAFKEVQYPGLTRRDLWPVAVELVSPAGRLQLVKVGGSGPYRALAYALRTLIGEIPAVNALRRPSHSETATDYFLYQDRRGRFERYAAAMLLEFRINRLWPGGGVSPLPQAVERYAVGHSLGVQVGEWAREEYSSYHQYRAAVVGLITAPPRHIFAEPPRRDAAGVIAALKVLATPDRRPPGALRIRVPPTAEVFVLGPVSPQLATLTHPDSPTPEVVTMVQIAGGGGSDALPRIDPTAETPLAQLVERQRQLEVAKKNAVNPDNTSEARAQWSAVEAALVAEIKRLGQLVIDAGGTAQDVVEARADGTAQFVEITSQPVTVREGKAGIWDTLKGYLGMGEFASGAIGDEFVPRLKKALIVGGVGVVAASALALYVYYKIVRGAAGVIASAAPVVAPLAIEALAARAGIRG